MSALTVPYLAAAALLVAAGWSKVVSPQSTVTAARDAWLRASPSLVRMLVAPAAGVTADRSRARWLLDGGRRALRDQVRRRRTGRTG